MFERLHRWLSGSFNCVKCGKRMYMMTFGYGEAICPDCYNGEKKFIFLDNTFILNRIILRSANKDKFSHEKDIIEDELYEHLLVVDDAEIVIEG